MVGLRGSRESARDRDTSRMTLLSPKYSSKIFDNTGAGNCVVLLASGRKSPVDDDQLTNSLQFSDTAEIEFG